MVGWKVKWMSVNVYFVGDGAFFFFQAEDGIRDRDG